MSDEATPDRCRALLGEMEASGWRTSGVTIECKAIVESSKGPNPEGVMIGRYDGDPDLPWAIPWTAWLRRRGGAASSPWPSLVEPEHRDRLRHLLRQPSVPAAGSRWRHWKGGAYAVVAAAIHLVTWDVVVAYRSDETGIPWLRTLDDFRGDVVVSEDGPWALTAPRFLPEVPAVVGSDASPCPPDLGPYEPAPGDRYREHGGDKVEVVAVAGMRSYSPGYDGRAVVYRRPNGFVAATPIRDWNQLVDSDGRAVRRFAPIPRP